jgi:hypothetical protein
MTMKWIPVLLIASVVPAAAGVYPSTAACQHYVLDRQAMTQ